jgi:hypothetical protein
MRRISVLLVFAVLVACAAAQSNDQKARVFITDSQSWQMTGNSGGANGAHGGHMSGGARPQTAEIIKTFGERCHQVVVNNKQDKADYTVVLDHEGGKSILSHDNKVAVFNSDGDAIVSHSTRSLGSSVKDACEAIEKDWPSRVSSMNAKAERQQPQLMQVSEKSGDAAPSSQISVSSTPGNADIEMDGSFVGSTPSTIDVTPGEHSVVVKKSGYKAWQRTMKVSGGSVNVSAELEKVQ